MLPSIWRMSIQNSCYISFLYRLKKKLLMWDDQDRPAFIVAGLFPCRQERLLSREDAWKVALKSKTLYNGRFCASDERVNTSNNTKLNLHLKFSTILPQPKYCISAH